jgi:hypothetical protein
MSDNLNEFILKLDVFANITVPEQHAMLVRKVAFTALKGIVLKTPVDTGRARANWSVTLGKPTTLQVDGAFAPISSKIHETQIAAKTIAAGAEKIAEASPSSEIIWINNNLPYIEALEHGHSQQQAPKGMVAITVNDIREHLV